MEMLLVRFTQGMDGDGVAGIIMNDYYGSFPHSLRKHHRLWWSFSWSFHGDAGILLDLGFYWDLTLAFNDSQN